MCARDTHDGYTVHTYMGQNKILYDGKPRSFVCNNTARENTMTSIKPIHSICIEWNGGDTDSCYYIMVGTYLYQIRENRFRRVETSCECQNVCTDF